jgi:hypothetical protein
MSGNKLSLEHFKKVLDEAYNQVAKGKGKERHGLFKEFDGQPWKVIAEHVGKEFLIGQAVKKLMELRVHQHTMNSLGDTPESIVTKYKWRADALGAIVYTAMTIMYEDHVDQDKIDQDNLKMGANYLSD